MIRLERHGLWIKILTREWGFLEAIKEHFSGYAEGYQFHPKYLSGSWDGKVYLMRDRKFLPYGVLPDLIKLYKREFSHIPLEIDDDVKSFFAIKNIDVDYSGQVFTTAPHQKQAIEVALRFGSGIVRSGTGSGKSFIMYMILKHLFENNKIKRALIIVPNTLLVSQLYSNFVEEYGFDSSSVGKVYSKIKEWDKQIVISTWQSLMNNHDKLEVFDSAFVDECLDENTLIKTPNGEKYIKNLNVGDIVISYNKKFQKFEEDVVLKIYKNLLNSFSEKMYELCFDNGTILKVTGNHKILTTNGYIRADELTDSDEIIHF